jgi:hypothetical protein
VRRWGLARLRMPCTTAARSAARKTLLGGGRGSYQGHQGHQFECEVLPHRSLPQVQYSTVSEVRVGHLVPLTPPRPSARLSAVSVPRRVRKVPYFVSPRGRRDLND